jgi:hydrogenase expression/formation protein HypC
MCLGVPAKILSIRDDGALARTGRVSFGGVVKDVNLSYTPQATVGNYVVVHVGFAISVVDEAEAAQVLTYLRQMDELQELDNGNGSSAMREASGG